MQPHTEPVCRFLCRAKIKKRLPLVCSLPGVPRKREPEWKNNCYILTIFLTISGQKGHQDRTVEGVRLHPILVLRVTDARAGPAAHDRRPVVRCQDTQQQGRTGTRTIFAVLLQYFFYRSHRISGIRLLDKQDIRYQAF